MATIRHSRRVDRTSVDAVISRGLRHKAARDRIQELRKLIPNLMRDHEFFTEFDRLVHSIAEEREKAFFDLGFEHGAAASHAKRIREASGLAHSKVVDGIAAAIRERILGAGLPLAQAVLVLIESMWIVALGFLDDSNQEDHGSPE